LNCLVIDCPAFCAGVVIRVPKTRSRMVLAQSRSQDR
jgi:hypothetical protein